MNKLKRLARGIRTKPRGVGTLLGIGAGGVGTYKLSEGATKLSAKGVDKVHERIAYNQTRTQPLDKSASYARKALSGAKGGAILGILGGGAISKYKGYLDDVRPNSTYNKNRRRDIQDAQHRGIIRAERERRETL
jgi:hypothetical protein